MVQHLPGARAFAPILWATVLLGLGLWIGANVLPHHRETDEKATLSVLRSESMAFLVTRRASTQIVINYGDSEWFGEWHGVLWATISWRWGVDMKRITDGDIRREGDVIIVHLPDAELLDFALEPGSVGFISKSTAMPKLLDFARGGSQRQMLEGRLREHALEFAKEHKLLPTRQEIVGQLNGASGLLERAAGAKLRFE